MENPTENKETTIGTTPATQIPAQEDLEAKVSALEAEKARLIEERANYRLAYLKEKKQNSYDDDYSSDSGDDEKLRRIAREELANSRLTQIALEQDDLIKKVLKENKEFKLAFSNKSSTTPPASVGTHNEFRPVQDTIVTSEQINAFKARGWTDKDIERYKKNLRKQM